VIDRSRRSIPLMVAAVVIAMALAACGSTSPSSAPTSPSAAIPTNAPTATVAPTPTSGQTPSAVVPTLGPTPTAPPAASAEACAIAPRTGRLPSDRMTDVRISSSATADLVTFVFGNMSVPEPPQGSSEGSLDAATPPYTEAASGSPVDVVGDHVAQVRFVGMSLMNDVGEPTYDGATSFEPDLPALKSVMNFDMSEGVLGWYIGYDGNGCVTLTSSASSVTIVIDHPAG
jgi:hypothetical protein